MKKFLTENWVNIIFALSAILVLAFGIIQVANTIEQKKINNFSIENFRKTLIDSICSESERKKMIELDVIKANNDFKIKEIENKVAYFKKISNEQKKISEKLKIKADSLSENRKECMDISYAYKIAYDSLKLENTALDSTNYFLDLEAEKYSENLYLTEKQLILANKSIDRKDSLISLKNNYISNLEKKVKNKNWINGFKIGFVTGAISGIGTAILIK